MTASRYSALLTTSDVQKRWRCSGEQVRVLRRTGRLPYVRLGHLIRFRIEDVAEYEAANLRCGRDPAARTPLADAAE